MGLSQSSQVGPDWTCIVVGFESGFVRFYTENCGLLLEEQLHNESVIAVKCQSQHSPRPDISSEIKPEELYVHYASNVCVINGPNLFSSLRDCRSHMAKGICNLLVSLVVNNKFYIKSQFYVHYTLLPFFIGVFTFVIFIIPISANLHPI